MAVERLVASALGELAADEDAEVEEHVLSCGHCAAIYASLVRLGPAIAHLVGDGGATMPITRTLVERLEHEGLITRRYELTSAAVVPCAVGADDIYSLTTYHVNLAGVSRVDLIRAGQRLSDVPFDAVRGRVYMLSRAEALRMLPTTKLPIRLVAVEASGERTLGEYTLDHTAFAPS